MDRYLNFRAVFGDFKRDTRPYVFFIVLSVVLGFALGIVAGIGVKGTVGDDLTKYVFDWYIDKKIGFGGYFGTFFVEFFLALLVILFCNLAVWLLWANYFFLIARGYILGYNLILLILGFGVGGAFCSIFILLPQQCFLLLMQIYLSVYANIRCRAYRSFCFRKSGYRELFTRYLAFFAVYTVCSIALSLVFGGLMTKIIF